MNERVAKWLFDILSASRSIAAFTAGKRFEDYLSDEMLRSAVERKFEIIGEALRRIREAEPEVFAKIDLGHEIIGMRNRLIHGYDAVDEEIVWETIETHLAALIDAVGSLL